MSQLRGAVFLSYASEDREAARRVCDALRAAGLEVWFDINELRGGDEWDRKIRQQIRDCALFVPMISANTNARTKGYFRREWKLGVECTHDLADGVPFIVPIALDATSERDALVPEEFLKVQWTRLPAGETTPEFVARVVHLVSGDIKLAPRRAPRASAPRPGPRRFTLAVAGAIAALAIAAGAFWLTSARGVSAKSVAVLPFENLSTDPQNAVFADGMQEEVISHLAKIGDLTVISRSSVRPYRDTSQRNLKKIAAELGVATILEGSVRRDGNLVRISARLIDPRTDKLLWDFGNTDRELTNIFALQSELAREIAGALKANLTPGERERIARVPTKNQAAYAAFLRGRELSHNDDHAGSLAAVAAFTTAVTADPEFALAWAYLSIAHGTLFWNTSYDPSPARLAQCKAAADEAVRLQPDSAQAHLALGLYYYRGFRDWEHAIVQMELARASMPNDPDVLLYLGCALRRLGRWQESTAFLERARANDPRSHNIALALGENYSALRRYRDAARSQQHSLDLDPSDRDGQLAIATFQFAYDGDQKAYLERLERCMRPPPDDIFDRYRLGMLRRDFDGALRALASFSEESYRDHRCEIARADLQAQLAYQQGDLALSRQFAATAASFYERSPFRRNPEQAFNSVFHGQMLALLGQKEEALRLGRRALELVPVPRDGLAGPDLIVEFAMICLIVGERDEAITRLDQAFSTPGFVYANQIRFEPRWAPLRSDPRFETALAKGRPL